MLFDCFWDEFGPDVKLMTPREDQKGCLSKIDETKSPFSP